MRTEPDDEELGEEPAAVYTSQRNLFARFAFDASRGRSHSHTAKSPYLTSSLTRVEMGSPASGGPSVLGKRKAEVDEVSTSLTVERKIARKTTEKSRISKLSSSKVKLYDHLRPLEDNLELGLNIVFCGINPGQQSAEIGHHYGNPNNHFWGCLHESGLTNRRLDPREDATLPRDFSIGLTNLVARPTAQQNELSKTEQVAGVSKLLEKVARCKPRVLCFVGLGIADVVRSSISLAVVDPNQGAKSKSKRTTTLKAAVGLQTYKMVHSDSIGDVGFHETLFFAVSSTSGRVVRYQKADKVKQFQDLRDLVTKLEKGTLDTTHIVAIAAPARSSLDSDITGRTDQDIV
ncbi:hypothetical protein CVT25_012375 [Psilocybe cyanescens]|uniref:Uracil-DNA glycosylase-like domain-containing protein n=1 Tax=Psilocybe cyanescens TaxID=93625 RepID=A0A409XC37_PSICY|nr:hypothetical protein CVT25_012375 [Psilocybe cyanescens]